LIKVLILVITKCNFIMDLSRMATNEHAIHVSDSEINKEMSCIASETLRQ